MNHAQKIVTLLLLCLLGASAMAAEAPAPMSNEQLAEVVKKAPQIPESLKAGLDLKLRLVDFIDCTDDQDPHKNPNGFCDQGTSSVTSGPAGKYRVTAPHGYAFFSYRFKSAGANQPVLLVFEYPDDAVRTTCFATHESSLSGGINSDWSLETGVYCGDPLPLTNQMQYHTFIWWPQDEWPCALVASWHRTGVAAAASRIWAYAIEGGLPKLEVNAPDPANQRVLGHYNSIHFLATQLYFGYSKSRRATPEFRAQCIERMLDYCQYVGINRLSWSVVSNSNWGFTCVIPSWDFTDTAEEKATLTQHLGSVLTAMDARPGMSFTAGFAFEGAFTAGGKDLTKMTPAELKAALNKGFDEFIDNYAKHPSLKGICLGAMYGDLLLELTNKAGITADVVSHLKEKCAAVGRKDIEVSVFVGGKGLFYVYFTNEGEGGENGAKVPNSWEVISGWEKSGQSWSDWLGEQVLVDWKAWGLDPDVLKKDGLAIYEQLQPDDFRVLNYYGTHQDPRAAIYYDIDRSQKRSDIAATPLAAIWNTHYEGHVGLLKDYNFWYTKLWWGPDFNAPQPFTLASFTRAMALRDRMAIVAGSWNVKYFGGESAYRRFARAYRSLPPVEMQDASVSGTDTAKVRWAVYNGKRYLAAMSLIPFAAEITVDGRKVALPPYELVAMSDDGKGAPKVTGHAPAEYVKWIHERLTAYNKLCQEVKALDAEAAPEAYFKAGEWARFLLAGGKPYAADLTAAFGLASELELRKSIIRRPELQAPKVTSAPPMNGNLDAWPKEASDLKADNATFLGRHLYFPNSWIGPADLSARLRLANDGQKLYIGLEVHDQKVIKEQAKIGRGTNIKILERRDACSIRLSKKGYMNWRGMAVADDLRWDMAVPIDQDQTQGLGQADFSYKARRTPTGYVVEGSASLAGLEIKPGEAIGLLVQISDNDGPMDDQGTTNLKPSAWAAKQTLLIPCQLNFVYYDDARTLGQLTIGK